MKVTAVAPANLAFIKYWGKADEALRLPLNSSISVNLSNLNTTTTVEFAKKLTKDEVIINGKEDEKTTQRAIKHLNKIRRLAGFDDKIKVISQNNFPKAAGLASSSSAFASLTLAASKAAGLKLSKKELSILARQGSGSACRSIPGGFVEWIKGEKSDSSYARSLFPADHWSISILALVVEKEQKKTSSSQGHKLAKTSPFLAARVERIEEKIKQIKKFVKEKNFTQFGQLVEGEALELHAICLTSNPPIIYWQPATLEIIITVQKMRRSGLPVYFTIDAGSSVFLIGEKKNEKTIKERVTKVRGVKEIIVNHPSGGARLVKKHLF